jgi:hypothetical protein
MTWRDQLALLLGTASPFGLAINAGLAAEPVPADNIARGGPPEVLKDLLVFRDPAERQRLLLFAGHRSHSSHSSHRSHSSHYSGSSGHSSHSSHYSSSGGSAVPAPVYTAPPAPKPRPDPKPAPMPSLTPPATPSPLSTSPQTLTGATSPRLKADELETMVTKVQVALIVRGYDPGPVNGVFGSQTKAALAKFQLDHHLPSTGFMDLPSLRLLDVVH